MYFNYLFRNKSYVIICRFTYSKIYDSTRARQPEQKGAMQKLNAHVIVKAYATDDVLPTLLVPVTVIS